MEDNEFKNLNRAGDKFIANKVLDRLNITKRFDESLQNQLENDINLFFILPNGIQIDKEKIKVSVKGNSTVIEFSTNQAEPVVPIHKIPLPRPKEFLISEKREFQVSEGKQLFITVINQVSG